MDLKLYNTLGKSKQKFQPFNKDQVSLYACGPTVYDYQHIGNLRTYIFEDILRRVLEYNNYKVRHVMNITDVGHLTSDADSGDDKLIGAIDRLGLPISVDSMHIIAEKYAKQFFIDCKALNILKPNVVCMASEHIKEMIKLIQKIENNAYTYSTSVGLIFDTQKFSKYSELANLKIDQLIAGTRVKVDPERKSPADFALWITNQPNHLMQWDSPWGKGFPGWHIECSAMSMEYLGEEIDIHCGGQDHINVHHTNEIAQSEAATGKKWVNYWLHGTFLVLDKQKMSKSQGGFICLSDVIEKRLDPLAYRYMCLSAHYRSQLSFTWDNLQTAQKAYRSLLNRINLSKEEKGDFSIDAKEEFREKFRNLINDDLNMPEALALMWKMLKSNLSGTEKIELIQDFDKIFGLNLLQEEILPDSVKDLIIQREKARKEKNWQLADELRSQIKSLGYEIEDHSSGTRIKNKL